MSAKPRIFIGSSVEGLSIAEHVQLGLDYHAECTLWSQGVFGLSQGTLESLIQAVTKFDFAVLVLTPDDLVHKRSEMKNSARDNVLFELGLFMGALGRDRTFIVYCRDIPIDLPTDLAGVTAATFAKRRDGNLQAALGAVCTQIKTAIRTANAPRVTASESPDPAMLKLMNELALFRTEFTAQTETVRRMMESITSSSRIAVVRSSTDALDELRAMEGVWRTPDGSTAYARIYNGDLRWPYCYLSGSLPSPPSLTGEYYNFKFIEGAMFGRFRWFANEDIWGYGYYRMLSPTELSGGWWMGKDIPEHFVERLPKVAGMIAQTWTKQGDVSQFPYWVEDYYRKLTKAEPQK